MAAINRSHLKRSKNVSSTDDCSLLRTRSFSICIIASIPVAVSAVQTQQFPAGSLIVDQRNSQEYSCISAENTAERAIILPNTLALRRRAKSVWARAPSKCPNTGGRPRPASRSQRRDENGETREVGSLSTAFPGSTPSNRVALLVPFNSNPY